MTPPPAPHDDQDARRRRARRTALWIALGAVAGYVTFIVINLPRTP
ncbi:MAG TPA: hypothetical protein VIG68_08145 [Lysobacter sp.]